MHHGGADAAAEVADAVGADDQCFAAGNGTAVLQLAGYIERGDAAGEQCAVAVDVAGTYAYVHLRCQYGLPAAVRQGDATAFQPDDVALVSRATCSAVRAMRSFNCKPCRRPARLPGLTAAYSR